MLKSLLVATILDKTDTEHLYHFSKYHSSVQFSSVALYNPMNCSMPGLPVHHQLLEFSQTHVHRVSDAIQPSHHLSWDKEENYNYWRSSVQFSSVAQSCLTLCDPMNYSMPGFHVHHQLPEPTQTHVHHVGDAIQPSYPLSSHSPAFNLSQDQGLFWWVSDSALVLPMNIQDWSPLGWTGWISLQSKGLSRVFSNTTVQKHQFFSAQLSL